MPERFFATCARGLESALVGELQRLGAAEVKPGRGGVSFAGDLATLYSANLWLRTAVRVLMPVLEAAVTSPDELYQAVQTIDWSRYLTPEHTLAVDANVRDSRITHSKYAALRVKDAICDQFMARVGRRPSVDTETPMVGLNLHIDRDAATLSLDSSGESLHKRGYRPILTKAPLNEALAAALVLLTGWRGERSTDVLPGLVAQSGPELDIEIEPALEAEAFAGQAWWPAQRDPGRFDRQRAGAAQRIDKRCARLPAGHQNQAGGERFVERGLGEDRPVAALVQRFAGAVEAERGRVAVDVQV